LLILAAIISAIAGHVSVVFCKRYTYLSLWLVSDVREWRICRRINMRNCRTTCSMPSSIVMWLRCHYFCFLVDTPFKHWSKCCVFKFRGGRF